MNIIQLAVSILMLSILNSCSNSNPLRFDKDIINLQPDEIANMGVSRTFQNIELFENMTTLDNILIGAHRHVNYGPIRSLLFSKKARYEEEKQDR